MSMFYYVYIYIIWCCYIRMKMEKLKELISVMQTPNVNPKIIISMIDSEVGLY